MKCTPRRAAPSKRPPGKARERGSIGGLLLEARTAMGLTCRELATRLDMSFATVAAIERGREPRWSTLMRLVERIPGMDPTRLLPGGAMRPMHVTKRLFDFLSLAHAVRARRVTVLVTRAPDRTTMLLDVEGLVATRPEGPSENVLRGLARLACVAPTAFVRTFLPAADGTTLSLVDELGAEHEITVTRVVDGPSVHYRRRYEHATREDATTVAAPGAPSWDGATLTLRVSFPIEELHLVVGGPHPPEPHQVRLRVGSVVRDEEVDLAGALHPASLREPPAKTRQGTALTVTHVLPSLDYGLRIGDGGELAPGEMLRHASATSFAPIAVGARRRSGLSQRALAQRMRVSHATLVEAERGRDVRASTLRGYLRALPELSALDVLPAVPLGAMTVEEAWRHQRSTYGAEMEEYVCLNALNPAGGNRRETRLTGLRGLTRSENPLLILLGARRGIFTSDETLERIVTEVAEDEADLRTRVVARTSGRSTHQLVIPGRLSRRGLSLSHVWRAPAQYSMTAARALLKHGGEGPYVAGQGMTPPLPCHRLRMEITFPARMAPRVAWCVAWSAFRVPDETGSIADGVQAASHSFESHDGGARLVLVAERPLVGLQYSIGWELP